MNTITLRDYDDVYFSITPLTRYVIQRAYRLDMDMDAEGVALYLKMREDEFAHKLDVETIKQQIEHDGIRQEMKDMAAKVTRTKVEDDYQPDVPVVDISTPARDIMEQLDMTADELPAVEKLYDESDRQYQDRLAWIAQQRSNKPVTVPAPSPNECPRCHQKMIVTVMDGEDSICLKCGYELGIPEAMQKLTEILTRTLDGIEENLGMTGLGGILRDVSETPSPEESWLMDIGAIAAADMDDDGPTPPDREGEWYDHEDTPDIKRHLKPHVTVTRPASEAAAFDLDISELLRLDYVLYSSTAVQTNNGPRLVAFMVAREFYRR